jgi:hypothetical protein
MAWSTGDLTDITNVVSGLIQYAIDHAKPAIGNVKVYCHSPDTSRKHDGYCHLTLYLLHVGRDPYWRNTPVSGSRGQLNSAQPLSLNLSYLLTAWCDTDYASEQRAMSVALQAIHSQPIVTQTIIQARSLTQYLPAGEFTMSIEADTIEEMSRLWQAITAPIRLSALIRVGVVFIQPAADPVADFPAPTIANLTVAPEPSASPTIPLLYAGGGVVIDPGLPPGDPSQVTAVAGPLTVVAGGSLVIAGNGLNLAAAAHVFLSVPGTVTEWDVTSWLSGAVQPDQLALMLPAAYANPATSPPVPAPPAATPLPGLYSVTVGTTTPKWRANPVPVTVAPRVDGMVYPPELKPDATSVYTVAGAGFIAAATKLSLGTLPPLSLSTASTPAAGRFTVSANGKKIKFKLPSPTPAKGAYPVAIQVNGVPAAPGWVVLVS